MAATAQTQRALVGDRSSWALRLVASRRFRGSWAAAGLAGIGFLVAAIVMVTVHDGAVASKPTNAGAATDRSASQGTLAGRFGSIVDSYQRAERTWRDQAVRVVPGSSSSAEGLIRPTVQFADTVDRLDHDLLQLQWPSSMQGEVKALGTDLASVSGDLRSIGGQSVSSIPQWISKVVQDGSQSSAAGGRLTLDLARTSTATS